MRIDSIQIENFRGIGHLDLEFDPRFTQTLCADSAYWLKRRLAREPLAL